MSHGFGKKMSLYSHVSPSKLGLVHPVLNAKKGKYTDRASSSARLNVVKEARMLSTRSLPPPSMTNVRLQADTGRGDSTQRSYLKIKEDQMEIAQALS